MLCSTVELHCSCPNEYIDGSFNVRNEFDTRFVILHLICINFNTKVTSSGVVLWSDVVVKPVLGKLSAIYLLPFP